MDCPGTSTISFSSYFASSFFLSFSVLIFLSSGGNATNVLRFMGYSMLLACLLPCWICYRKSGKSSEPDALSATRAPGSSSQRLFALIPVDTSDAIVKGSMTCFNIGQTQFSGFDIVPKMHLFPIENVNRKRVPQLKI